MRIAFAAAILLLATACGDDKKPSPDAGPGPSTNWPRAAPQGSRPLTEADLDNFMAINAEMKKGKNDAAALTRILEARGLATPEWTLVHARLASAWLAVLQGSSGEGAPNKADIEFVRAHKAKLEASIGK